MLPLTGTWISTAVIAMTWMNNNENVQTRERKIDISNVQCAPSTSSTVQTKSLVYRFYVKLRGSCENSVSFDWKIKASKRATEISRTENIIETAVRASGGGSCLRWSAERLGWSGAPAAVPGKGGVLGCSDRSDPMQSVKTPSPAHALGKGPVHEHWI